MTNAHCGHCQKVAYVSRGAAKKVIKFRFAHESSKMQPYRCPTDEYGLGWFHIGHKYGMTREQHRRKATERSDDRLKRGERVG